MYHQWEENGTAYRRHNETGKVEVWGSNGSLRAWIPIDAAPLTTTEPTAVARQTQPLQIDNTKTPVNYSVKMNTSQTDGAWAFLIKVLPLAVISAITIAAVTGLTTGWGGATVAALAFAGFAITYAGAYLLHTAASAEGVMLIQTLALIALQFYREIRNK